MPGEISPNAEEIASKEGPTRIYDGMDVSGNKIDKLLDSGALEVDPDTKMNYGNSTVYKDKAGNRFYVQNVKGGGSEYDRELRQIQLEK